MNKLNFFFLYISISAFIFVLGCTPNQSTSPDYPASCLKGTILDSSTHKPLAGVNVTTAPGSASCISDTAGIYFLAGIPMSSSGTNILIIASRTRYLNDTIPYFLLANDTAIVNFCLSPSNGVFCANNIDVFQPINTSSYSSLDLSLFTSKTIFDPYKDLDLLDSSGVGIRFRFQSAYLVPGNSGFITKIANSIGNYTKYQFDTLAKIYDAGDSIQDSYFSKYITDYFVDPLAENSVYPFYLLGRYPLVQNQAKTYGLLYLKSTRIENGLFVVTVDVKVNRNGLNYFIPYNK
jgi:hypothetical protein